MQAKPLAFFAYVCNFLGRRLSIDRIRKPVGKMATISPVLPQLPLERKKLTEVPFHQALQEPEMLTLEVSRSLSQGLKGR